MPESRTTILDRCSAIVNAMAPSTASADRRGTGYDGLALARFDLEWLSAGGDTVA